MPMYIHINPDMHRSMIKVCFHFNCFLKTYSFIILSSYPRNSPNAVKNTKGNCQNLSDCKRSPKLVFMITFGEVKTQRNIKAA